MIDYLRFDAVSSRCQSSYARQRNNSCDTVAYPLLFTQGSRHLASANDYDI